MRFSLLLSTLVSLCCAFSSIEDLVYVGLDLKPTYVHEAAAAVPRFPAIYNEDLYDAFEYAGIEYLQIQWHEGSPYRNFLTYDAQTALAGHNFSLCYDYSHLDACKGEDLTQNLDVYLLVTYARSDLMISNTAAHGHSLYHNHEATSVRLGLGTDSPLRVSDEKEYWNQVRDAILEPLKNPPETKYRPAKIIFVGDGVTDDFVGFVEAQVYDFLNERKQEPLPDTIALDPIFVQAKGVAELARRRPYLPTPQRPGYFPPDKTAQAFEEGPEL